MWTFGGTRIIVQEIGGQSSRITARLQPLTGETVQQFFGIENTIHTVSALVVGHTDLEALLAMNKDGDTKYTLSGDSFSKDLYLINFNWKRIKTAWQTLRQDLDCTAPVYAVELEVHE